MAKPQHLEPLRFSELAVAVGAFILPLLTWLVFGGLFVVTPILLLGVLILTVSTVIYVVSVITLETSLPARSNTARATSGFLSGLVYLLLLVAIPNVVGDLGMLADVVVWLFGPPLLSRISLRIESRIA